MRERQGALVERYRLAVFALLGKRRAARGDQAPVGINRVVGGGEKPAREANLIEVEGEAPVFARQLAAVTVENRGLLQHGEGALLLPHGLEVAREIEGYLEVAGGLGVLLAPILGCLLEFAARARGNLRVLRRAVQRKRVGHAGRGKLGAATRQQARRKAEKSPAVAEPVPCCAAVRDERHRGLPQRT